MDESKSSSLRQYAFGPDVISNQYVHDLYRFFAVKPHMSTVIFSQEESNARIPALKDILCKPELLANIADLTFPQRASRSI